MNHQFVETIPKELNNNVLYISLKYNTIIHKCPCGCGEEVVTPLSPYDWKLTYNGESISLYPSIGNWNYKCRSHYWIKNSTVVWSGNMEDEQILLHRKQNDQIKINASQNKNNYYKNIYIAIKSFLNK
jgi:hypothetical protein